MRDHDNPILFASPLILGQIPDMIFVMSANSPNAFRYQLMNPSAMQASGLNDSAYGATFHDVVEPAEAEFLHGKYAQALTSGKPVSFVLDHEGQIGESVISPIYDTNQKITSVVGIVRDITERVRREKQLEYLAFRDQLTGLFNRHAVVARLNDAFQKANCEGQFLSILLLDCDNLKVINDRYGHMTGDFMLKELASRLQTAVPSAHTIARVGGDEFLVAALAKNEHDVFETAENILGIMRRPWNPEMKLLSILVSIGVSIYPIDSMEMNQLLEIADKGLYQAKKLGGNQYKIKRMYSCGE